MKLDSCARAESVVQAARTGRWSDEIAAHVAKCVSCRQSSRVVRWMIELAETVDSGAGPLPDPELIWLKARILRRSQGPRRALLPIRIASVLSVLGLGAVLASLPREGWSTIPEWLARAGALASELPSLQFPSSLTTLWIPAGLLAIVVVLFTASEA